MNPERKGYNPKPLMRSLFFSTLLAGIAGCAKAAPLEVYWDVNAQVATLVDVNNPTHRSDEFLYPEIPNFVKGPLQKELSIPWGGYFYISCDSKQVIGPDKLEAHSFAAEIPDNEEVAYLYKGKGTKTEDGRYSFSLTLDRSKALTVDKKKYRESIERIKILVDERRVHTAINRNGEGSSIIGTGVDLRAAEFITGIHKASCLFETSEGSVYSNEAQIKIFDDRS